ncbi:hypothetical protein GQ473_05950 [archaeon]|nr:hypothetical protein [archaeon]
MVIKNQNSKEKKHIITKTKIESKSDKTTINNPPKIPNKKDTTSKNIKKPPIPPKPKEPKKEMKLIETYKIVADNVGAIVEINTTATEYVPLYVLQRSEMTLATHAILNTIKDELITMVNLTVKEFVDPSSLQTVKEKFIKKAMVLMEKYLPFATPKDKELLAGNLIHEMLGLGEIELILADPFLEEIVINGHTEPIWVYHKHHGWLKTNIMLKNEEQVYNYASAIGRRVGRQITNLEPLMDAHLTTGDRVNATLFPISTQGNTITIRKFSRSPWTIIHFLDAKTFTSEVAGLLWLAIQYELNILVAGGTAAGKTSMLNILMPFMPPNQRIISIEDTREINLPKFLHWVPFSSRGANPEGKGAVSMLDLLTNSLRMRPDRIIIGEIRRTKEAEVMFEAIRTGHSAYATFHGDKAEQVYKRLTNPPMNLPEALLGALHLIVVQYRHRRKGVRRTLEVAELIPTDNTNALNIIYRWNPRTDKLEKINKLHRMAQEINLFTGMSDTEIDNDIQNKAMILEWMMKRHIKTVNTVGKVIAEYYRDQKNVIEYAKKNKDPYMLLGAELAKEIINNDNQNSSV